MTALWLDNLHQHEMLTVILAGCSLLMVLAGWVILSAPIHRILRTAFLVVVLAMWVIVLAGSAWLTIYGGGS